jgi:hypothetical protein
MPRLKMRPPARRGHRGLRPGGKAEVGRGKKKMKSTGEGEMGERGWKEMHEAQNWGYALMLFCST